MNFKKLAGLLGLVLFIGFLLPPLIKLKEVSIGLVMLIGIALAGYEYYENLRNRDDA